MDTKRGIVFAATGDPYFKEAVVAAKRVREVMPGLPIVIFTDHDREMGPFDAVYEVENPMMSCGDKIQAASRSPFEETLFLDPDTFMIEAVDDLFLLLEKNCLAISHATYRESEVLEGVPESFPELNTGVFVFRRGAAWTQVVEAWKSNYRNLGYKNDQPALRKTLWEAGVSFGVLTPEFQFRTHRHCFAGEGSRIRIIHGRHAKVGKLAAELNRSLEARVYLKRFKDLLSPRVVTESRLHRWLKQTLGRLIR